MNRFLCMAAGMSTAAALLAGCSGTSLNSNVAHIRAYDGATATTTAATIYINDGSANGDQDYEQVSNYLYLNSGTSDFSWGVNSLTGGSITPFPDVLLSGGVYTAVLLGRADEQFGTGSPILDITLDDQTAPPPGDARIRLIDDAPDANGVDIYVNGTVQPPVYYNPGTLTTNPGFQTTSTVYPGTLVANTAVSGITSAQLALGTPFSEQTFGYVNIPAGSVTIKVNEAGSSTTIAGPTTFTVHQGDRYTFFLLEPTVTPSPTYSLQQIPDAL